MNFILKFLKLMSFLPHDTWLEISILLVPNKISISIFKQKYYYNNIWPKHEFRFLFFVHRSIIHIFGMRYVHIFSNIWSVFNSYQILVSLNLIFFEKIEAGDLSGCLGFGHLCVFILFIAGQLFGVYWTCIEFEKQV